MNKVLCRIFSAEAFNDFVVLYIGRDDKGYAYWEHLGSSFGFRIFRSSKGDWWYNHSTKTLDIYISDGKSNTLYFSLAGVPDNFLPPTCGPDTVGAGIRFPDLKVEYSIGGSGTCERPPPRKPRRGR
jgi:hypothetical protein